MRVIMMRVCLLHRKISRFWLNSSSLPALPHVWFVHVLPELLVNIYGCLFLWNAYACLGAYCNQVQCSPLGKSSVLILHGYLHKYVQRPCKNGFMQASCARIPCNPEFACSCIYFLCPLMTCTGQGNSIPLLWPTCPHQWNYSLKYRASLYRADSHLRRSTHPACRHYYRWWLLKRNSLCFTSLHYYCKPIGDTMRAVHCKNAWCECWMAVWGFPAIVFPVAAHMKICLVSSWTTNNRENWKEL